MDCIRNKVHLDADEERMITTFFAERIEELDDEDAQLDKEELHDELLEEVSKKIRSYRRGAGYVPPQAIRHEISYSSALEEEAASSVLWSRTLRDLAVLPDVIDFRARSLSGGLLSGVQWDALKRSPLATIVPTTALNAYGVPLTAPDWRFRPTGKGNKYTYEVMVSSGFHAHVSYEHDDLLRMMAPMPDGCSRPVQGALDSRALWSNGRILPMSDAENRDDILHPSMQFFGVPYFRDSEDIWVTPLPEWEVILGRLWFVPFGFKGTFVGEALQLAWDIAKNWHLDTGKVFDWLPTGCMLMESPVKTHVTHSPLLNELGLYDDMCWSSVSITTQPWISVKTIERQFLDAQSFIYKLGFQKQVNQKAATGNSNKQKVIIEGDNNGGPERSKSIKPRKRMQSYLTTCIYSFMQAEQNPRSWKERADEFNLINKTSYTPCAFQQQYSRARKKCENMILPRRAPAKSGDKLSAKS